MKNDLKSATAWALEILLYRSVNERKELSERISKELSEHVSKELSSVDSTELRQMVLDKLKNGYAALPASDPKNDDRRLGARSWLLSILGILGYDEIAATYLREELSREPEKDHYKARFWALESLVRMKVSDLKTIAEDLVEKQNDRAKAAEAKAQPATQPPGDPNTSLEKAKEPEKWPIDQEHPTVTWLAKAIRLEANSQNVKYANEYKAAIMAPAEYGARRAMRYVPLPDMIEVMCKWLHERHLNELVSDAVQALMRLTKDHVHAASAKDALMAFLRRAREHSYWDDLRSQALRGLRRLSAVEAESLFIEELYSPNLSILYEAAKGLEAIVQAPKATQLIVEAASKNPQFSLLQYGNALRCMDREVVAAELEHLMNNGGTAQQEVARGLLHEIGGRAALDKLRSREETMRRYLESLQKTDDDMRKMFERSIEEARSGYTVANMMNLAIFLVGLAFLGVFLILIMQDSTMANDAISKIITGTGGALAIIYNLFVSKPMDRMNASVRQVMSLKVTFLGYLRQLEQADLAFNRRFLEAQSLTTDEVKVFEDIIGNIMQAALTSVNASTTSDATADASTVVA